MASQLAADYAVPSNRAIRESMLAYNSQQSMLADDSKMEGSRITNESTPSSAVTTTTVTTPSPSSTKMKRIKMIGNVERPDLFFYGIVVKVNGYTNPDNETLKRLLQKHGGDLETYETTRVTHLIAETLSKAKADMYKKMKQPRPVCTPSWIVDSVNAGKLLPYGNYLLPAFRHEQRSVGSLFFRNQYPSKVSNDYIPMDINGPDISSLRPFDMGDNEKERVESYTSVTDSEDSKTLTTTEVSSTNLGQLTQSMDVCKKRIDGKLETHGSECPTLEHEQHYDMQGIDSPGSFKIGQENDDATEIQYFATTPVGPSLTQPSPPSSSCSMSQYDAETTERRENADSCRVKYQQEAVSSKDKSDCNQFIIEEETLVRNRDSIGSGLNSPSNVLEVDHVAKSLEFHENRKSPKGNSWKTDDKYINGKIRTSGKEIENLCAT